MKKLVLGLLVAAFVIAGTATAGVRAAPPQTDVTGVITENSVAVAGANVTALCNGNTQLDTTDAFGSYLVIFTTAECPFGSTVKITAEKDGKSGVMSGTVQGLTTKLNLAIVNVSIPEYGLIGTLAAAGAGVGFMAYARRRQQQQLQS